MNFINAVADSLGRLVVDAIRLIPMIIVAVVIWIIGVALINLATSLIRRIDLKGTNLDNRVLGILAKIVSIAGRILLILIILDYFGIGEAILAAIAGGLTLTFAIAIGLAFGRAIEGDAKDLWESTKGELKRK
ncbi:hypothetical protein C4578_01565 [Candidatus Microgenomates bacterium]|jgi:small-conductance mechanosensitive channel|nr:MAG: hypothetical protein C4578_01565 [Candidatus Microgenomates bacterium]